MTAAEQAKIRRGLAAPHHNRSRATLLADTITTYSERSNVRKFLRQFARPSTLLELIEVTSEFDHHWHSLLVNLYTELNGPLPQESTQC